MFSSRSVILLSFAALCWGANVSAQTAPVLLPQVVQQRIQQPPVQQGSIQQQPIQAQPIQTPLFGTQESTSVYQIPSQPAAQPAVQQPPVSMQPIRVATTHPPVAGQPLSLYDANGMNQVQAPPNVPPPAGQGIPPGMTHMGRSEPTTKIIPFFLTPAEQQELDMFLARWEKYSADIRRYDVDFDMFIYDPTNPGAEPNKAYKTTFGYFKYIANPMRFVYGIEGEWIGNKPVKRDGDKNMHIFAEKMMITEKSVFKYDYNSKTMYQINVPPEMIGKGIADSPLPLIFGAKADELKKRFSMKIVPIPGQDTHVWLHARPLLLEDQQEFKELEILIDKKTLHARGLRLWDINDKAYKVYSLKTPTINARLQNMFEDIKAFFTPEKPLGWKHEVSDWPLQPPPVAAIPQFPVANPQQSNPQQPQNEFPLYRVQ